MVKISNPAIKQSNDGQIGEEGILRLYLMTPTHVIIKAYEHNTDIFNWI